MAYEEHRTPLRNMLDPIGSNVIFNGKFWVVSSVGRASALHAECRQFETVTTHQEPGRLDEWLKSAVC